MDQSSLQTDHKWIKLDYITCITYKSKCCRSHFYFYFTFSYFCRRIHNCAPIVGWVGRGGRRGGLRYSLQCQYFSFICYCHPSLQRYSQSMCINCAMRSVLLSSQHHGTSFLDLLVQCNSWLVSSKSRHLKAEFSGICLICRLNTFARQ